MKIKQRTQHRKFSIRHPKRLIIITAFTLVGLAMIAYGIVSYLNWDGLKQRSGEASVALKSEIEGSVGAKESKTNVADQIDAIITDFERKNGENPCLSPRLFEWQTVIPALKTDKTTCEQKLTNARATIATLKPLSAFLKDQTKANKALAATIEATKSPTDYAAAAASWKALADSPELSQASEFKAISISIVSSATLISNAYSELAVANKDENRDPFDAALAKLKVAYQTLGTVTASSKVEQTRLVTAIVTAYERL